MCVCVNWMENGRKRRGKEFVRVKECLWVFARPLAAPGGESMGWSVYKMVERSE